MHIFRLKTCVLSSWELESFPVGNLVCTISMETCIHGFHGTCICVISGKLLYQKHQCNVTSGVSNKSSFYYIFSSHAVISVLPSSGPVMTGLREVYLPGEVLSVKCFTQPADPPPEVTMYVNNKQV